MRVLFAIALCASSLSCARQDPAGPAWPKWAERESDGGESLAPRAAARAIAAAVEDDHAADRAAGDKPAAPAPATPAVPEKPAGGTVTVTEEPLSPEDMVIEVDDPDKP
ncbi:MAG TPA: hypothetical protein VFD36_23540 [Kofleriaceae bacterium]|nr:hypothetical protein [Kofleriaceae bacterium]